MSAKFSFAKATLKNAGKKTLTFFKNNFAKKPFKMPPAKVKSNHNISCTIRNICKTILSTILSTLNLYTKKASKILKHFVTNCYHFSLPIRKKVYKILCQMATFLKRIGSAMKKSVQYMNEHHLQRNLAALAVFVCIVGSGVFIFTNYFDIGYRVMAHDTQIGTVKEKSDYYLAQSLANTFIANSYGNQYVTSQSVTFEKAILPKNTFSDRSELKKQAIATNDNLSLAYVVNIDGVDVLSADTKKTASAILNSYKERYRPENCAELKFNNTIVITQKYAPKDMKKNEETGLDYLIALHYQAASIDNMAATSEENAVLTGATDTSQTKNVTLASSQKPVLEVVSVQKTSKDKSVPYETTTQTNPNRYEDEDPVVLVKGIEGKNKIESTITRVNSVVVSEVIDQETVVTAPVNEVVEYGSKKRPTGIGTGSFSAPISGRLTSPYGSRSRGFHTGLDLAAPIGTTVKAADDGKVIFAGYKGGYGNLVIINHQNGYVTYYAHNSALHVSAGDIVEKGSDIAAVGSTGNSTGPHCHFEIRVNGETVNPYSYIF